MSRYRIHRLKDVPRENFRWAAHTSGLAIVKAKDYQLDGEIDAATPYAAWKILAAEGRELRPGDLLERNDAEGNPSDLQAGDLQIIKYIGFEPAKWFVPEPQPDCNRLSIDNGDAVQLDSALPAMSGSAVNRVKNHDSNSENP